MKSQVVLGLALDLRVPARRACAAAPGWAWRSPLVRNRALWEEHLRSQVINRTKLDLKENQDTGLLFSRKGGERVGTALPGYNALSEE